MRWNLKDFYGTKQVPAGFRLDVHRERHKVVQKDSAHARLKEPHGH